MKVSYKVLIPKERVAVLLGEGGKMKKMIEQRTSTKIIIKEEEVTINSDDSYKAWITQLIIKAIGRGFKPSKALILLNDGYKLEIMDITDFERTRKGKVRIKGRIIGEEGKTRKFIEKETGCHVSVYGKTISIIGSDEWANIASNAVAILLNGAQHNTAYNYIQKEAKKLKKRKLRTF